MRRLAVLLLLASSGLPLAAAALEAPKPAAPDTPKPQENAVTAQPADADVAKIAARLAAHRAVYALSLDHARGDVVAASGTMTYEITDACDGWAARQRLQMTISNREGQPVDMVSDYTTFESKDGTHLTFRMRQTTEQAVGEDVEGTAKLNKPGGSGEIHYTKPSDRTEKLPAGTLFPMWHTATIIAAAEAGKRFLSLPLFDGTGSDGAQDSSVAITSWAHQADAPYPALQELPSGRVHVAFFSRQKNSAQPDYEVGMRYWENGVADQLLMEFGEFAMAGKLKEFALQPSHC